MLDTFPEKEDDSFDAGYHQAKNDIIELLNENH